ncbi:hypothetical protein GCM10022419_096880 [Nonomuraea rosea]|uniref:MFS transporter n=1 Tax=Nonomuraea rosea TaxID=638574 RepID=A0ABP6Z9U4_9ACTN
MSKSTGVPSATANRSYRDVLRNKRVAGLLLGDLLANIGTGMIIVAMPVQTLRIHGRIPPAIAIGMVEAAPFILSTVVALGIGLGRVRIPPRTLLIADCVLRALTFTGLGLAAVTGRLSLSLLIGGLLLGAACRMAAAGSRRLLATSMAEEPERYGVNALLGLNGNVALYVLGPVAGGLLVAAGGPGVVLFADACGALLLLACVLRWVPRTGAHAETGTGTAEARTAGTAAPTDSADARQDESGWRILRRRPVAARLLVVVFFFNFLYMPIEVALPLYVQGTLHSGASGLGLLWGALGAGAIAGAALVNLMRGLPQRHLLVAIIGLWALCPIALAAVDDLTAAMIVFALGGLVWAPFTPVSYSFLQSGLRPSEQQPVVTLWTTGSALAAPLGLVAGGPLIQLTGTGTGLVVSGLLTLLLVPIAAVSVLKRGVR